MENAKRNKTKQILLFDDEAAAQKFLDEHNRGAAVPEYSLKTGLNFENLDEVFDVLTGEGFYMPLPDKSLWERATTYHTRKKDQVSEYLNASGLTDEETSAVLTDYFNALRGNYNFAATPATMNSVLRKTQPYKAFLIDRYGLYRLLLLQYYYYARTIYEYLNIIKDADDERKYKYITENITLNPRVRGVAWALMNRYITLLDFSGIPTETVVNFSNNVRKIGEIYDYGQFYHVCKHAYFATPEELKTIRPPQGMKEGADVVAFGEAFSTDAENALNRAAEQYAIIINKETPQQEREQEQDEAAEWSRNIYLPVNYNRLSQRPIEVSTSEQVKVTTALKSYIDGWLQLPTSERFRKQGVTVNEYTIQQVIGGLSLLKADRPQVKPVNGLLTYKLNISEFAEYCGYKDANNYVKEGFLGGLMILNNLFLIVDRPERIHKRKNGKGVYKTGGKTAINLIRLRQYDITKENTVTNIVIDIVAGNLGGVLKPLSYEDIKKLQAETKGLFVSRFDAIIIGMNNKKEEDIVDDCAGFSDMLKHAETDEEMKVTREYIRKKKPAARKKVQALFERRKELGVIKSYTRTQNKAGEWVYKWKRGTTPPSDATQTDLFADEDNTDAEQTETGNAQG